MHTHAHTRTHTRTHTHTHTRTHAHTHTHRQTHTHTHITPLQLVAELLTKLLMFCKECANCRNESKCGEKTLLVLRTSDGTNLVKLVKCPKGGGRCSTENQFQAWVISGLFGNSPICGPALNCVSGRDC